MATIQPGPPSRVHDERSEGRNNIFLVAAIYGPEAAGPVRVRNMSPRGALIEGSALPSEGSAVRLSRGSLSVAGCIAWQSAGRAGVRFDTTIAVADWLPGGQRPQQQKIDAAVHAYKNGAALLASASPSLAIDLRAELLDLEQMLRRLGEELVRDSAVCERHLTGIQSIDIAAQKLAVLAARQN
jgi:hypothetical protein